MTGDVNCFIDADILAVNISDERFVVWQSNGTNYPSDYEARNGRWNYSGSVFLTGDVNGDVQADLIAFDKSDERFVVWQSDGTNYPSDYEARNGRWNYSSYEFHTGDVNGDGKDDIIAIHKGDERFVVWLSDGRNYPSDYEARNGRWNYSSSDFHVEDVNGDGRDDIIAVNKSQERFVAWNSDGRNYPSDYEAFNGIWNYNNYGFHVGHVNNDDKADVIAILPSDERFVRWLRE